MKSQPMNVISPKQKTQNQLRFVKPNILMAALLMSLPGLDAIIIVFDLLCFENIKTMKIILKILWHFVVVNCGVLDFYSNFVDNSRKYHELSVRRPRAALKLKWLDCLAMDMDQLNHHEGYIVVSQHWKDIKITQMNMRLC